MSSDDTNHLSIQVIPSAFISEQLKQDIITLVNRAYEEEAFETFVGATHVLGSYNNIWVSHALWITRYLQVGAAPPLRTAYVELVATEPAYQHRGFASSIMRRLIAEVQDYDLAALSPFSVEYYERLGWELWRGPLFIRAEGALVPSPADEEVMIFRLPKTPPLDLDAPLSAEWREGELW